jgi:hemimethylated DNA binding protein
MNEFLIPIIFRLCRIRNSHTKEHFKCYDPATKSFVPNELKSYEFPMDRTEEPSSSPRQRQPNESAVKAADTVTLGVKDTANYLKDIIMQGTTACRTTSATTPELKELKLLSFFLDRLNELSSGDVIPVQGRFNSELSETTTTTTPPHKLAIMHLQQLHNLVVEAGQLLWQRRVSMEDPRKTLFSLGDVVEHEKYGFRGVIVAWDPKPSIDVSRWDGLQHITDPHEYPFYHIIPDQNDCIEAFGAERSSRYVCEANLTMCPIDRRNVDVDLEPEWEFNHADRTYIPPEDLKVCRRVTATFTINYLFFSNRVLALQFKYAGDLNDDGVTEKCLIQIKVTFPGSLI